MARKFVVDGREWPDPDPNLSVDQVKQMMTNFFPELDSATTTKHEQGGEEIYEFIRRTGTKGLASWEVQVKTAEDRDWVGNGIRLATKEEADTYGSDLAMRWTAVLEWQAVESAELVNYHIENGKLVHIPVPVPVSQA